MTEDRDPGQLDPQGYGVDVGRGLLIYHRWGTAAGALQRFMIVLNFSPNDQAVTVPFPENGVWALWADLLSDGWRINVGGYRYTFTIGSNWDHLFFQ